MHPISWVGVAILAVALAFFARSQFKPPADGGAGEAKVWKLNVSGPSYLIVMTLGVAVLLFPFTGFFGPPDEPVEDVTPVTVPDEITLATSGETTAVIVLPPAPYDYDVYFDEGCGTDILVWYTDADVVGWWVIVDIYDLATEEWVDSIELDRTEPWLCAWEFFYSDAVYYYAYVYSYDDVNYSEDGLAIPYP